MISEKRAKQLHQKAKKELGIDKFFIHGDEIFIHDNGKLCGENFGLGPFDDSPFLHVGEFSVRDADEIEKELWEKLVKAKEK